MMNTLLGTIPDGPSYPEVELPDWRADAIESDDADEQRKANYSDPKFRRERALDFIERDGSAWGRIVAKAEYIVKNDGYFKFDYEVETLKRAYAELGYTPAEIRDMFNNCNSSTHGFLVRELCLCVPDLLPNHIRLRRSKALQGFYPQLEQYEDTAYMGYNVEEIGE